MYMQYQLERIIQYDQPVCYVLVMQVHVHAVPASHMISKLPAGTLCTGHIRSCTHSTGYSHDIHPSGQYPMYRSYKVLYIQYWPFT